MEKDIQRFKELWSYANKEYSLPGKGIPWLESWVKSLNVTCPSDYQLVLPAYEYVMNQVRKARGIWGLDGCVEQEILREIFGR